MSLFLRLTLAFLALVSLVAIVGVTSFTTTRELGSAVATLRGRSEIDLRKLDLDSMWVEIDGFWTRDGTFVADDVEAHPGIRRPQIRGAIREIDTEARAFTMYGRRIRMATDTQLDWVSGGDPISELSVGQRLQITCEVENGEWIARVIQSNNVKRSDKVKGTPSVVRLDGKPPETIEIEGLVVAVAPDDHDAPEGATDRLRAAVQMVLSLQQWRAAAYEVVGAPRPTAVKGDENYEDENETPVDALGAAQERFEYQLERSRMGDGDGSAARWIGPMTDSLDELESLRSTLVTLAGQNRSKARTYLDEQLDPFVEGQMLPMAYGYLGYAQERLGERLRWIVASNASTTRVALTVSVVAVILALVLGFLVWRSISGPIQVLHAAAVRIGEGHLDTRVDLDSKDEIGTLAAAFNKMAAELGASTVSLDNLEGIFDSMAAALIIFSPEGQITNVNRAAVAMFGYKHKGDVLGASYDQICEVPEGDQARPMGDSDAGGILSASERVFIRRDGNRLPVSFSGTQLRRHGGPLRGYVCVAQDLSGLKTIEGHLRSSLAEKELLLREVHHRVKNNLQIICSMLAMQGDEIEDTTARGEFLQSETRIRSMALMHEQLFDSDELAVIDMRSYLESLTMTLAQSYRRRTGVRIQVSVSDISVNMDQALACGLVVSELVSRSLKFVFEDDSQGSVTVTMERQGVNECSLVIEDTGLPMAEAGSANEDALGMSLVAALVQQIRGTMTVRRERRNEVRIQFPLGDDAVMVA